MHATDVAGPEGRFLVGNLIEFFNDPPQFLSQLQRHYGDVVRFRMGRRQVYALFDPELIGQVYIGQHDKFIKNRAFWNNVREIFGNGLLTNEGESWKRQRRIAAPAFQPRSIATYFEQMVALTEARLAEWPENETFNAHDEMMLLTADIVAHALFGAATGEHGARLLETIQQIEHMIPVRMKRPFNVLNRLPLPSNQRYRRAVQIIEEEIFAFIEEHEQQRDSERNTLLQHLMNARYDDGSRMSRQQLRDEVLNVFLAGHDTTAITLSWSFYLLSQHPEAARKLQEELDAVLGDGPFTYDKLPRLTFTKQVIQESLRLYPAAHVMGRETTEPVQVGDYSLPKGCTVLISPYVMHRLEKYFPEADKFKPERWTETFTKSLPRHVFVAFGGGPRVCIGEHFSMMEAMVILALVYRRFDVHYAGHGAPAYFASITLPPRDGMPVQVQARA